jgi:hypothetical protein
MDTPKQATSTKRFYTEDDVRKIIVVTAHFIMMRYEEFNELRDCVLYANRSCSAIIAAALHLTTEELTDL